MAHVDQVDGRVEDAHALVGGRRVEPRRVLAVRELLDGVELGSLESGRARRELGPRGGAVADRPHQARIGEERFDAVRGKGGRTEMREEIELGIGSLQRAQDVVRAVLGHVVVVEPRLPELPQVADQHRDLALVQGKLVLP